MTERHTGNLLVDLLAAHDVSHVFGLPGAQSLPLYDALQDGGRGIGHVIMRDERNLPYAALAYARITGKVGVLDATVGPGAAMLPVGLAEAHNSATPLVALLSELPVDQTPMAEWGMASQGMDQLALLAPVTKWQARLHAQSHLSGLVRQAFHRAAAGRPGPVAITIPEDIYNQRTGGQANTAGLPANAGHFPAHRSVPEAGAIAAAAVLIAEAKRPVLVAGGGTLLSGAEAELLALAERLQAPVATTLMGKGAIAETHPLAVGVLGPIGAKSAEQTVRAADLVILVGFKNAQNSTFSWTLPAPHQKVIHIEQDGAQIGRFFPADMALAGDAKATLAALQGSLSDGFHPLRPGWLDQVASWKAEWAEQIRPEVTANDAPILPQRVVAELAAASQPGDIVACDASFASGWGAVYYPIREAGRRMILPRGMAGLGFGLPAALGAAVAAPDRTVFCLAGDGGFAYTLGELAALKANGIKVVSVVLNNASWGWMEWLARINWNKEYFDLPNLDFARTAEGLGCKGITVSHPGDLAAALRDAIKAPESVVVDVKTAVWETPVMPYRGALAQKQQAGYFGVTK